MKLHFRIRQDLDSSFGRVLAHCVLQKGEHDLEVVDLAGDCSDHGLDRHELATGEVLLAVSGADCGLAVCTEVDCRVLFTERANVRV